MSVVFVATSFARVRWEWLDYRARVRRSRHGRRLRRLVRGGGAVPPSAWEFRSPTPGSCRATRRASPAALGRFITNNFLTPKVLSEKLVKVDAAQWVADWLADPDNARSVARRAAVVVPEVVRALPRDVMADALGRSLVAGLKAVPAGPVAANLLGIVWAQGETQKLLDRAITLPRPR